MRQPSRASALNRVRKTGPKEILLQKESAQAGLARFTTRVRNFLAYKFYEDRLKKYRILRLLAPWVWRKIQFLYLLPWIYTKALKRPLVSLSTRTPEFDRIFLTNDETVKTPTPEVFPEGKKTTLITPHSEYVFPGIYIAKVSNALVTGATNLVVTDDAILCHDLYDFSHDYTSEELNGRTYIWPNRHRIAWLMRTVPIFNIDAGACFTDACAYNYAHWITEVLPRICQFCQSHEYLEVPIIINGGLHRNLMESLQTIAGTHREVITLSAGVGAQVKQLLLTSAVGYVPFERRSKWLKNHSHGRFSPHALMALRKAVREELEERPLTSKRRIFIKRNSGIRNITNAEEIERLLITYGFHVIEPEKLTFAQQVALFSNVDMVVGATGAAMANLIFCEPFARIIIMIPVYRHTSYWYWQNIACAVGNRITYVLGKTNRTNISGIHSDFYVDPSDVLAAIGVIN